MGGTTEPDTDPGPVVTNPDFLDSINWGTQLSDPSVTVYFAGAGEILDGKTSVGWNDYEVQQAMLAFQQFANVCNVSFTITTDQSQADLTLVNKEQAGYLGYFNPPGTNGAGIGVFNQSGTGWAENLPGTGGLEQGGYGFITLIHEFGHALGMAHPHDRGGSSTVWQEVTDAFDSYGTFDLNQGIYTVMSYNDGWNLHPSGENTSNLYGWEGTMMAFDVALLQQLYGANMSYATGDDTYVLADENVLETFFACIWDAGGRDEMVYAGSKNAVIDLRPAHLGYAEGSGGYISFADGIYGGFTIANGVTIENASGGSGDDTIRGNDARNALGGNDGQDQIFGLAGRDHLMGGGGADLLCGGAALDHLKGGAGADDFLYLALDDSGAVRASADRIAGFVSGSDHVDLSGLDGQSGGTADDAFVWIDTDAFSHTVGELRWQAIGAGVLVQGDRDGDGVADFALLLTGVNSVVVGDFML